MNNLKRDSRSKVLQARLKWINTMKSRYPGFDAKRWEKNSAYRNSHPQGALSS